MVKVHHTHVVRLRGLSCDVFCHVRTQVSVRLFQTSATRHQQDTRKSHRLSHTVCHHRPSMLHPECFTSAEASSRNSLQFCTYHSFGASQRRVGVSEKLFSLSGVGNVQTNSACIHFLSGVCIPVSVNQITKRPFFLLGHFSDHHVMRSRPLERKHFSATATVCVYRTTKKLHFDKRCNAQTSVSP